MKKKIIVLLSALALLFIGGILGVVIFYNNSLKSMDNGNTKNVVVVIDSGSSSKQIIDELYDSGLIKNKFAGYVYLKLHNNYNLQAGTYELNTGMDLKDLLESINKGDVVDDSVSVTLIEGKRLTIYAKNLSEKFGYSEDEILNKWQDKEYLEKLIDKYWFLTDDVLNDKLYYALEGYIYPNTYSFNKDASIEEITEVILNNTDRELSKYKNELTAGNYSVSEILAMASIIELEAVNSSDRAIVSQVIYKRLDLGMTLGMDVTTYYAVRKDMSEELWAKDLIVDNPYNTRVISGLPVGPICNPSGDSIKAALNPTDTNYIFFYADVTTGDVYFAETEAEFQALIAKYRV